MLKIQEICKSYATQVLFDEASLQMTPGERLGLIARNGQGKSTLFRMILGEEHEDAALLVATDPEALVRHDRLDARDYGAARVLFLRALSVAR